MARDKINITINSQKGTTRIQSNIVEAMNNLSDLSRKQKRMKIQKKIQCSSPVVIEILDESDSENEVITRPGNAMCVKRKLPFSLSDDSDDSNDGLPVKAECSPRENGHEEIILNKPSACSTPLEPSVTTPVDKGMMSDDSESTIILENSYEKSRISIEQNILITPAKTRGPFNSKSSKSESPSVRRPIHSSLSRTLVFSSPVDKNISHGDDSESTQICLNNHNIKGSSDPENVKTDRICSTPQKIIVGLNRPVAATDKEASHSTPSKINATKSSNEPHIEIKNKQNEATTSPSKKAKIHHISKSCESASLSKKSLIDNYQGQSKCSSSSNDSTASSPIKSSSGKNQITKSSKEPHIEKKTKQNEATTSPSKKAKIQHISKPCESASLPNKSLNGKSQSQSKCSSSSDESTASSPTNGRPDKNQISVGANNTLSEGNVTNLSKIVSNKVNTSTSPSIPQTPPKVKLSEYSPSSSRDKSVVSSNDSSKREDSSTTKVAPIEGKMPETSTKGKLSEHTPSSSKGKSIGSSNISSKENDVNKSKNVPEEGNISSSSSIYRTPTKPKLSKSPPSSPSKRGNKTPSPKKEKRMNLGYLRVFEEMFSSVSEAPYLRSLIEEETALLRMIITSDPKYFYVILKLFTWMPKRYNIFKFCEKILVDMEDKEVLKMYTFLQRNGIVDVDFRKEDVCDLLNDLDLASVKGICEKFKLKKTLSNKNDMINALSRFCRTQSTLTFKKSAKDLILDEVVLKMGKCFKLKDSVREAFYKAFLLGTFTNPSFIDVHEFFRSMMVTKPMFPEYRIEDYVVFYSKVEFSRYAIARRVKDGLEEALRNHNHIEVFQISETVFNALKDLRNDDEDEDRYQDVPHLKRFTAQSVYLHILTRTCEHLRTKYPEKVRDWLRFLIKTFPHSHRSAEWYLQLTWLHMRYIEPFDYVHSAKLLIEILRKKRDYVSDVQLQKLGERGEQLKISKKYKIDQLYHDTIAELVPEPIKLEHFPQSSVDARAIRSEEIGKKRKYLVHDSDGAKNYLNVESVALEYYIERCGYTGGMHCEGSLIKATFTLFFWDLIYNPDILVPGTFLSKYQEVPLDMMTSYFYTNRKDAIDKRIRDIYSEWSDSKIMEFVKHSFDMHSHESGLCEPGLYIKDAEMLETIVNCIGRKVLAKIYERLVKNIKLYLSGMPDLLVWNVEGNKSKFVEVKGESDTLSVKQKLWLKYLKSIGAHIEVCLVHSMGSKRRKKVKCLTASTVSKEGTEKTPKPPSAAKKNRVEPESKNDATPKKKIRLNREREKVPKASTSAESAERY